MPSYMDLYRAGSRSSGLSATSTSRLTGRMARSNRAGSEATLWSHRLSSTAKRGHIDARALTCGGARTEIEIFLSTQMVDEARHTVFFDRWCTRSWAPTRRTSPLLT